MPIDETLQHLRDAIEADGRAADAEVAHYNSRGVRGLELARIIREARAGHMERTVHLRRMIENIEAAAHALEDAKIGIPSEKPYPAIYHPPRGIR